jgi:peptidoglycan/xylan/chitin deacetylase (PgdA/CDA1 family)
MGSIFCLHHICPGGGRQKGFAPNSKLEIEPEFLEAMIKLVRDKGMETLPLDDAVQHLKSGKRSAKPFAVFTLDDGYKDNRTYGQPIFNKLQCPYTIFVAPRIVEGTCELWWRILELVINTGHVETELDGRHFVISCKTDAKKWQAWNTLFPRVEKLEEHEQRRFIRELAVAHGVDVDAYCRAVAMDWDELRAINQDPLCTIGAHTLNHHSVGKMSAADALRELAESRHAITKELGEDIRFSAYPYGDEPNATARDFKLAAEAGYEASLTTRKGVCFAEHGAHLQALPRIMVSGRYQALRYVDAMMSGLPTAMLAKFSHLNVG